MTPSEHGIHFLWATKGFEPLLTGEVAVFLNHYLAFKAADLGLPVLGLSVQPEHVHLLVAETGAMPQSDFMHELKGASSYWLNRTALLPEIFRWQKGFDVFSVKGESVARWLQFLKEQKKLHRRQSFFQERQALRKANPLQTLNIT